jgi:hypothetical protein
MVGILPTLGPVGLEGANSSFQVHLRDRFADHFNAAQLAAGPVLAVAGNSPTFLGHRLWQEARVALFKQAVDDRDASGRCSRRLSRVAFRTGWITSGPLELLEESMRLHEPVLPVLGPEQPLDRLDGGGVPALDELRLHQGTVWRWNRAIYDPAGAGHLRIELRALPLGTESDRHAGQRRLPARPDPGPGRRRRHPGAPVPLPAGPPTTGAAWQRQALAALEPALDLRRALAAMLERYLDHQHGGSPVHAWPLPG